VFSSTWFEYVLPPIAFAVLTVGGIVAWLARRHAPRTAKLVTCGCAAISIAFLTVFAIAVVRHPILVLGVGYWLAAGSSWFSRRGA
jgi:hypothetical protein